MKEGWQCPACKTIYAPHVEKCECAKENNLSLPMPATPYITVPCNDEKPIDAIGKPLTVGNNPPVYTTPYNPDIRIWYGDIVIPRAHHF